MEGLLEITNSFEETIDKFGKTIFRESEGSNDRGSSVSSLAQSNFFYKGQHPPSTFDETVTNARKTLRRNNNDDLPPSTFDENVTNAGKTLRRNNNNDHLPPSNFDETVTNVGTTLRRNKTTTMSHLPPLMK